MNLRVVARGFQPRVGGLEEAALQFAAIVAACVLAPGLVFAQELPTTRSEARFVSGSRHHLWRRHETAER